MENLLLPSESSKLLESNADEQDTEQRKTVPCLNGNGKTPQICSPMQNKYLCNSIKKYILDPSPIKYSTQNFSTPEKSQKEVHIKIN